MATTESKGEHPDVLAYHHRLHTWIDRNISCDLLWKQNKKRAIGPFFSRLFQLKRHGFHTVDSSKASGVPEAFCMASVKLKTVGKCLQRSASASARLRRDVDVHRSRKTSIEYPKRRSTGKRNLEFTALTTLSILRTVPSIIFENARKFGIFRAKSRCLKRGVKTGNAGLWHE